MMFSTCGSGAVFWMVRGDRRPALHEPHRAVAVQPMQREAMKFTMSQLAYVPDERLRDTPEGAGNLLDHSSILVTTEHTEG
jgi:hypothetical protein